jgi:hypothetical protein
MNTKLLLLGIGAYLLYQYVYRPTSPSMLPPGGGTTGGASGSGSSGSNSVWTGVTWIHCNDPNADPVLCAQMANPT